MPYFSKTQAHSIESLMAGMIEPLMQNAKAYQPTLPLPLPMKGGDIKVNTRLVARLMLGVEIFAQRQTL